MRPPLGNQPLPGPVAQRTRIKDVASIEGIRDNQLIGYGIVVGLRGTGDTQQTVFPIQTLLSTLERWALPCPRPATTAPAICRSKIWPEFLWLPRCRRLAVPGRSWM
jgi:hypothetical protein